MRGGKPGEGDRETESERDRARKSQKERISSPKASNGQRFPCPAVLSP